MIITANVENVKGLEEFKVLTAMVNVEEEIFVLADLLFSIKDEINKIDFFFDTELKSTQVEFTIGQCSTRLINHGSSLYLERGNNSVLIHNGHVTEDFDPRMVIKDALIKASF